MMIFYLNKVKVWRSVAGLDLVIKGEKVGIANRENVKSLQFFLVV